MRTVEERVLVDSYVYIILISHGPVEGLSSELDDTTTYRSYRVVIVGRSIFKNEFQGSDIYIEEFISGPEGCCKRLIETRKVDLYELMRTLKIEGEPFGLWFKCWLSPRSFEFVLCNKKLQVIDIDKKSPTFTIDK